MKLIRPFNALRPRRDLAAKIAVPPYDVLNREEALAMAEGNPLSFLRINKPEIDVDPSVDAYDDSVYRKGAENLQKFIDQGYMLRDDEPTFYIYRQVMGSHQQTGVVAAASVDAYEQNLIRKHEFTRPKKEEDRIRHIDTLNAQVGPVFLTYRARPEIDRLVDSLTQSEPEYDFVADDGNRHVFWVVRDSDAVEHLQKAFDHVECLYVADGHHRSAAAQKVRDLRREANDSHTGEESYNFFSSVIFPDNQMQVLDYNRVINDLGGLGEEAFLYRCGEQFNIQPCRDREQAKPRQEHDFGLYLAGRWFVMTAKEGSWPQDDPVNRLDVAILQNNLLEPVIGITDPRRDERVDFVGGIRGLKELERRVDSGEWKAGFALYPTSIASLMEIADAGEVMPPKSTWFEPKLKSGLFVHVLD